MLPSLNFIADTAIRASCPYYTSHCYIISVDASTADYLCFLKPFLSDSLQFDKAKYLEDLHCFGPVFVDNKYTSVVCPSSALESLGELAVSPRLHQYDLPRDILGQLVSAERV